MPNKQTVDNVLIRIENRYRQAIDRANKIGKANQRFKTKPSSYSKTAQWFKKKGFRQNA